MINILVADDHPLFRRGLIEALSQHKNFNIRAEANDGKEALKYLQTTDIDIAILDINMPIYDGLVVLRKLKRLSKNTKAIILTMYDDVAFAKRAFELGASGYLLKDNAEEQIIECVLAVIKGDQYSTIKLNKKTEGSNENNVLSPAENKVFDLVLSGYSNIEIASILSLSVRTVENHRAHITKKLGLKGPNAIIRYGARKGLITTKNKN